MLIDLVTEVFSACS